MIKLRIDVDYPYASRTKSFLYVALRIKSNKNEGYLKLARIIAQMINESPEQVKTYWFFTPYTIPDQRMLDLLNTEKHEVAVHVATNPFEEWKTLEKKTGRKVQYYTIHGTQRRAAQILWGRKLGQTQATIPKDFPLQSLHDVPTLSFDMLRYQLGYDQTVKDSEQWIEREDVLSMHPEWLFTAAQKTRRGPFYDALKTILKVDQDIETLSIRKTANIKIGRDCKEYHKNIQLTDSLLSKLKLRDIDIFTFIERKWCCPISNPPSEWIKTQDNIALLEIKDYSTWWNSIGKKTRNMIRKAEKDNVKVSIVPQTDKLAEGIWKIYNETPIRQGRAFLHYGETRETVTANMNAEKNSTYIGAYIDEELVGFIQILHGDNIAILSNILAMQIHWDKSVNNALIAKAVEVCAEKGEHWLMYGRIGNHPSLDRFKENNGFTKLPITRYYVPITSKGKLATKLGLHQELKDTLPDTIKYPLLPAVNWVSRTKTKIKLSLRKTRQYSV
ncbi:MAG: GNAT family N-acetyltransferase [Nitrososphaerota archaeon]|nr:GNAT family N-acetyltransferase [Nitrososphaerota archaeon]